MLLEAADYFLYMTSAWCRSFIFQVLFGWWYIGSTYGINIWKNPQVLRVVLTNAGVWATLIGFFFTVSDFCIRLSEQTQS